MVVGLWLGDMMDAMLPHEFDSILVVLEQRPVSEPSKAVHIPILNAYGIAQIAKLEETANWIDEQLKAGKKTLTHCAAGIERSPLTLAWYLWRKRNYSWSEAYALLKEKRPEVQDRTIWLPSEWISRVSLISASAP